MKQIGRTDGILAERETGTILCIPTEDLPSGTPGHILRQCNDTVDSKCTLKSYSEACDERSDCYAKTVPVPRLRSTCARSIVKISDEFTSLSKHDPKTNSEMAVTISHGIVIVADILKKHGFGQVVDIVVLSILRLYDNKTAIFGYIVSCLLLAASNNLFFLFLNKVSVAKSSY